MATLYVSTTGSGSVTRTQAQNRSTPATQARALAVHLGGDRIEFELGAYGAIDNALIAGPSTSQKTTIATVIDAPPDAMALFQVVDGSTSVFRPAADNLCLERVELKHGDKATTTTHNQPIIQTDSSIHARNVDYLGCKIGNTRFHCVLSRYGPTPSDAAGHAGTPGLDDANWRWLGCEVYGANQHLFVAHGSGWEWGDWTNPYTGARVRGSAHNWGNSTEAGQGAGMHGIYHHSRGAKIHHWDWRNDDASAIHASAISQRASGLEVYECTFHDCVPWDAFWYDNQRGKTRYHHNIGWNLYNYAWFFNAVDDTGPAYDWVDGSTPVDDLTIAKNYFNFADTHTNGSSNAIDLIDATAAYLGDVEIADNVFTGDFVDGWDTGSRGTAFLANSGHTGTLNAHHNIYHRNSGAVTFRHQNTTRTLAQVQAAGALSGFVQETGSRDTDPLLGPAPSFAPLSSTGPTVDTGAALADSFISVGGYPDIGYAEWVAPPPPPPPPLPGPPTIGAAGSLAAQFAPYFLDDDGSLVAYITACALGRELVDGLVRDADAGVGWSGILDVDRCPTWALRWLGQTVGVFIPIGTDDATARAMIRTPEGFRRCTVGAMKQAVARTLTSRSIDNVLVLERQSGAWSSSDDWAHFTVATYTDDTPDVAATTAAVASQTPAWLQASVIQISHRTYLSVEDDFATYADAEAGFATYADAEAG